MAKEKLFNFTAERLEQITSFNRLEARGTLRIALKGAGFEAESVTSNELRIVIERVLPNLLVERGINEENEICHRLIHEVARAPQSRSRTSNPPK